jgi:hypothetical protein
VPSPQTNYITIKRRLLSPLSLLFVLTRSGRMEIIMKKHITTFLAVLLAFAVLFSAQAFAHTPVETTDLSSVTLVDVLLKDEAFTNELSEKLLAINGVEYWENLVQARENNTKLMDIFSGDKALPNAKLETAIEPEFPDFIGGVYYNDDGNMVVQVVNKAKKLAQTELSQIFTKDDAVIQETVNYSKKELTDIVETLNEFFLLENRPQVLEDIVSFYEDTINNKVVIETKDISSEATTQFRETVLDSPIIQFVNVTDENIPYACNDTITISSGMDMRDTFGGSVGYLANKSGKAGFVTAAHCVTSNQSFTFGDVTAWKRSGSVDAAFIQTNSKANLSYGNLTGANSGFAWSYTVGDRIIKMGARTGVTEGKITTVNYNVVVSGIAMSNMIKTNVRAGQGDSGGIVIQNLYPLPPGAQGPTVYVIAGIITGGTPPESNDTFFCRADKINSALGLTQY